MRPLSPLDAGFLSVESREMPMHVGSLLLFRPPPEAEPGYLRDLYADFVAPREYRAPFNQKLTHPLARVGMPHWGEDDAFDIEYHMRHSALPSPGRYRELFVLVSRLHGTLLDRSRALWEIYLIEGLKSGQFALYAKFHHGLIDGIAGMRLLQSSLSKDPEARHVPYAWTKAAERQRTREVSPKLTLEAIGEMLQSQLGVIPGVGRAMVKALASLQRPADSRMAFPFEAPRSVLNPRITGARRFVAQSYALDRINRTRAPFGATVNDIVLAMCASALRRYLAELGGGVPPKPLTAMAPVSVRPRDGEEFGNAVSAVLVNLGTHIEDPVKRLETIQRSINDARSVIKELSLSEVMLYTILVAGPVMAPALLGLGAVLPPTNVVISNVPGPQETLYLNGAKLEGMYPASIVFHGMAVNITVTSYAGSLDFGIVACRKSVPRVQRIIDFLEDGLMELEQAAGIRRT